ncbi:MAG: transketolase [Balneolaceae bacterium]
MSDKTIEQRSVDTIRTLSMDAVQAANSGHPGMPMGMADAAYVLWTRFLKHNPDHPEWANRDRFILSAGHGSMLLYSLLHLTGYDLSLEEIRNFRQLHSITPGHPEAGMTPGVETTTGPLGQGFSTGVGMAMAQAHLAARFNPHVDGLVDHYIYAIVSDGDLMEGVTHESASMAGHLKLGKLIYLYDSNRISIDGSTDLAFTEHVAARFDAYGWHTIEVDGHDREDIARAIEAAQKESDRPSLVVCRTHIGFGSPNKQDSASSHGAPLGEEEIRLTKERLGEDPDKSFYIPEEVATHMQEARVKGKEAEDVWKQKLQTLKSRNAEAWQEFQDRIDRNLPNLEEILPVFEADKKGLATRASSGQVLQALASNVPHLLGGSADLAGSNKTAMDGEGAFQATSYEGRNIHYGVREHAMGAAMNGMALHGGVIPFGGTFLIFSDYCRPAIRVGALSRIPVVYVFTHDSIGLGEDGPTHQPIEQLASLRAIPNVTVLRPADANETAWAWKVALERTEGPVLLALTRQNLPTLERTDANAASLTERGAYVVRDASNGEPELLLLSTGSELHIMLNAADLLEEEGIGTRVVSMPSWELFRDQSESYRESVLPSAVRHRISLEAGATQGWHEWVGSDGVAIGLDRFGESAPFEELYEYFELTADRVVREAKSLRS